MISKKLVGFSAGGRAVDGRAGARPGTVGLWVALALTLLLAACDVPFGQPPTPTLIPSTPTPTPQIARVSYPAPPLSLDPVHIGPLDTAGNDLIGALFVSLASLDGDGSRVYPALARAIEMGDQGQRWTLSLRDDVFWMKFNPDTSQIEAMRPVTADDVVFAARRACQTNLAQAPVRALFIIQGCAELNQAGPDGLTDEQIDSIFGVHFLNPTTIEFTLTAPAAYFPSLLTLPALTPLPRELLEQESEDWTDSDKLWASGPFVAFPAESNLEGLTLITNPNWPLTRAGNLSILQISFEGDAGYSAWQTGERDVSAIPAAQAASLPLGEEVAYRLLVQPALTLLVASFDTPPMDNPDVRRALSLALDRDALLRQIKESFGTAGLPAFSLIPPGSALAPTYAAGTAASDPEAAQAALAAGGYEHCQGLIPITLLTDDTPLSVQIGKALIEQWKSVLQCPGSAFELQQGSAAEVEIALRELPTINRPATRPALVSLSWQADYPDAYHWLSDIAACREMFPQSYANQSRTCGEVDQALLDTLRLTDDDERAAALAQIEAGWFGPSGEFPVIPLYFYARPLAIQNGLQVIPLHAGPLDFEQWIMGVVQ